MKLKSIEKEDKIMEAVLNITYEIGLAGLKMAQVADRAEIAHGTLYIYFKNKKDIINSVYSKIKRKAATSIIPNPSDNENYIKALEGLWRRYLSYVLNNNKEIHFMKQCASSDFLSPENKELSSDFTLEILAFFDHGKANAYLKDIDNELIMSVYVGLATEIINRVNKGSLTLTESLINNSFEICWNALRR